MTISKIMFLICMFCVSVSSIAVNSIWVYPDKEGKLHYKTTEHGDRIMDYSFAGYKNGGVALPDVEVKIRVSPRPQGEDCSSMIQDAINKVSAMTPDENGFRGTVLLNPGRYYCSQTLKIENSGVVLRGSGSQGESASVIEMGGEKHRAIVIETATKTKQQRESGSFRVQDLYVPFGSVNLTLNNVRGLNVGDYIEIVRPVTKEWIALMNMDKLLRNDKPQIWLNEGSYTSARRKITAIDKNRITLEIPLPDSYDALYLGEKTIKVYKLKDVDKDELHNSAIESLKIVSPKQAVNFLDALYSGVQLSGCDLWMKDVYMDETMNSINLSGRRITIQDIRIIRKADHTGSAKPAEISINGVEMLINRCHIEANNVFYVGLMGRISGPNVVLNCQFRGNGAVQGHMRWSTAFLIDNTNVEGGVIELRNRGTAGSGHGWSLGWSVAWNCTAKTLINQQPPGAYNWMIGCTGSHKPIPAPGDTRELPEGIFDSEGVKVAPLSLYLAQLEERLGKPALTAIGYGQTLPNK